jgi:quinoprotein glucose dehydrogenase
MSADMTQQSTSDARRGPPRIYASLVVLLGLALLWGGVQLLLVGGSLYYVLAGGMTVACGMLLWRGRIEGAWLYGVVVLLTLIWALWEVGFDFWGLLPRLGLLVVFGLWLFAPWTRRGLAGPRREAPAGRVILGGSAVAGALILGALLHGLVGRAPDDPIYQAGLAVAQPAVARPVSPAAARGDWLHYGADPGGTRFSPLDQINPDNVGKLKQAWVFETGYAALPNLEVTPLKIGRTLYLCDSMNDVIALDAETGRQAWRFESHVVASNSPQGKCRGLGYYKNVAAAPPAKPGDCTERIITATVDARLIALDAATGAACPGFGDKGQVSLLTGMSEAPAGYYYVSSAPTLVRGKIVVGGWVSDGQYWGEPSGVIRAYDAVTGKFAWAYDVGQPDRHAEPPPGETYTKATPNSWAPMSADEELGLVYVPTGNATPDYYAAQRRPIDDAISSSTLAIDAETGALRWSFQTTHHDIWDYDVASQPTLVDIAQPGGGVQKALVQPTKRGELFLLDRVTGKPLAEVTEHPAPQKGAAPGERLAPTQPFSDGMPSTRGPNLREADMWGVTPFDQIWCRIKFRQARYEGPMTPTGLTPNIEYPGFLGGEDWGGVSANIDRGLLLVNSNRVANYNILLTRAEADRRGIKVAKHGMGENPTGGAQAGTPYAVSAWAFMSPLYAPCQAPPYGMLSAIDLTTHKLVWTRRFGTARNSGPLRIPSHLPIPLGTPNMGGSATTRSGLMFVAAAQDLYLRAIDVNSGKELWKGALPAGGHATPAIYLSPDSGREFVVIAAGGSGAMGTKTGDYVIAFALPLKMR